MEAKGWIQSHCLFKWKIVHWSLYLHEAITPWHLEPISKGIFPYLGAIRTVRLLPEQSEEESDLSTNMERFLLSQDTMPCHDKPPFSMASGTVGMSNSSPRAWLPSVEISLMHQICWLISDRQTKGDVVSESSPFPPPKDGSAGSSNVLTCIHPPAFEFLHVLELGLGSIRRSQDICFW